eukprot:c11365_g1_i1.p1 GENE.c11365_g1_i1~~c11365_g1_i1.p1  ORF type:complete len:348 (+),score=37.54 c11365_g1_i1:2-1045(+)
MGPPVPMPVLPPPPPPRLPPLKGAARSDVMGKSSSGAAPLMIGVYLLIVVLFFLFVIAFTRRRSLAAKYAAQPECWQKRPLAQSVLEENPVIGIAMNHPLDPFSRLPRAIAATIQLAAGLLVAALLPVLQPSLFEDGTAISSDILQAAVLPLGVTAVFGLGLATPIMRAGSALSGRARKLAIVCGALTAFALLGAAVPIAAVWQSRHIVSVLAIWGFACLGALAIVDPIAQILFFVLMGATHAARRAPVSSEINKISPEDFDVGKEGVDVLKPDSVAPQGTPDPPAHDPSDVADAQAQLGARSEPGLAVVKRRPGTATQPERSSSGPLVTRRSVRARTSRTSVQPSE